MDEKEFIKLVELITAMSIDYVFKKKLTRETYISNLKMITEVIEEKMSGVDNGRSSNQNPEGNAEDQGTAEQA